MTLLANKRGSNTQYGDKTTKLSLLFVEILADFCSKLMDFQPNYKEVIIDANNTDRVALGIIRGMANIKNS
jgi:hypothetical protein